jgi:AP-1 complex subunit mu
MYMRSFIPPDGEFDLMSYRLQATVKPLIWVEAVVESHSHSRIEYMIKAKSQVFLHLVWRNIPVHAVYVHHLSQFKSRSIANNVEIVIPVPCDVDSPAFKSSIGQVIYYVLCFVLFKR